MSSTFSQRALECLHAAGWLPGRSIDIRPVMAAYARNDYHPDPHVVDFLRQFNGLQLIYPHSRVRHNLDGCRFDAETAAMGGPLWVREYEQTLGEKLIPIGEAFHEHMLLMMTSSSSIYAAFEDTLCIVGIDYVDAINNLCEGKDLAHVPHDDSLRDRIEFDQGTSRSPVLSPCALKCLAAAGWVPERRIETSIMGSTLSALMGEIDRHPALDFLSKFGNLVLTVPTVEGKQDHCSFHAVAAAQDFPVGHFAEYKRRTGKKLVIVGKTGEGIITLLMADDGAVYGGMSETPDWLFLVGRSPQEALNVLCKGQPWSTA